MPESPHSPKRKNHIICSVTKRQCSVQTDPGREWPECSWARGGVGEAWSGAEVPAFKSFRTPLLPKWELRVSPYWPHLLRLSLTPLIIVYWKEALKENQKDIVMPQEGPHSATFVSSFLRAEWQYPITSSLALCKQECAGHRALREDARSVLGNNTTIKISCFYERFFSITKPS